VRTGYPPNGKKRVDFVNNTQNLFDQNECSYLSAFWRELNKFINAVGKEVKSASKRGTKFVSKGELDNGNLSREVKQDDCLMLFFLYLSIFEISPFLAIKNYYDQFMVGYSDLKEIQFKKQQMRENTDSGVEIKDAPDDEAATEKQQAETKKQDNTPEYVIPDKEVEVEVEEGVDWGADEEDAISRKKKAKGKKQSAESKK
jgi:hypothetical protein